MFRSYQCKLPGQYLTIINSILFLLFSGYISSNAKSICADAPGHNGGLAVITTYRARTGLDAGTPKPANDPCLAIDDEPADQQVCEGSTARFTITASGTITGYQWYRNGQPIAGATRSIYEFVASAAQDGEQYSVDVLGPCDTLTSQEAELMVDTKSAIMVQPLGATKCAGDEYTFTVTATNAGAFQWMKDGVDLADEDGLSGSQSAQLTITSLCASCDPGNYTVEVFGTGACDQQSVTSSAAQLVVNEPVSISTQPVAQQVCEGSTARFTVAASGTVSGHQWYRNGVAIAGANGSTYEFSASSSQRGDEYKVEVQGPCGNIMSSVAALTVNTKPAITVQPVGAIKCVGEKHTFTVNATNAGAFQWMKNGADLADEPSLSGSTTSSLTITSLCASCDPGSYTVEVFGTGACDQQSITSSAAQLVINEPVSISSQPVARQVCEGEKAVFSVTASGTVTGYQWYRNGQLIVGATSSSYEFAANAAQNGDKYTVEVLGPCGNLTSQEAAITVNTKPAVTVQPLGATKCVGENYTFTVTASNADAFQWMKNGVALVDEPGLSGSITSSLTITSLCASCDPGSYTVEVFGTGSCDQQSVTSSAAQLVVNEPVSISSQPADQLVCEGATARFTVTASGTVTGYQWYRNGQLIAGATSSTYEFTTSAAQNGAKYSVEVLGPCGNLSSQEATLTVNTKPTISVQPVGATKCAGEEYTFTVTASNAGAFQWMKNGADLVDEDGLSGSETSSLTITSLCARCDPGSYTVKIFGTGSCDQQSVTSNAAQLVVNEPVQISSQPSAQQVCEGSTARFTVTASGTVTGYQWYRNGQAITGATSSTYEVAAASAAQNGTKYSVEVLGPCGTLNSSEVQLTVNTKPTITVQPVGATKCVGENYTFTITASNAGGFQWMKNGVDLVDEAGSLSGSRTSTLTLTELCSTCDAGNYTVKIFGTGACDQQSITSSAAQLVVNEPVRISIQPVAQQVCEGSTARFTVTASGTVTGYQWYRNGQAITGAMASTYEVTAAAAVQNGAKYSVEVQGPCGNLLSSVAELTVTYVAPPTISTSKPDGLCIGEQALLTATGCAGTVNWFLDDKLIATGVTYTTQRAGTYTTTCTNSGCTSLSKSNAITVVQHTAVEFTSSVKNVTCFGGADGSISITPSGSAGAPYTVSWTNQSGGPANTLNGLSIGTYEFTVKDRIGCSVTSNLSITQPQKPTASLSAKDVTCFGKRDGTVLLNAKSDYGNFTYRINNGTPVSFSGESVTLTNLDIGTYSISIVDGKGCEVMAPTSVTINEPSAVVTQLVTATNPRSFDSKDGSVEISVSGGINPYFVNWYDANSADITHKSQITATATGITSKLSNLDGGNYRVVVKDKNGCGQSLSQSLIAPKRIEIVAKVDSISCFGRKDGKIAIAVTGGVAYAGQSPYKTKWLRLTGSGATEAMNTEGFTVDNLAPGLYEVVVSDANQISVSAKVQVVEPDLLTSKVAKVVPNYCLSQPLGEATLTITGGRSPYTATWNGTTVPSNTIPKLPTGTHTITVADASGCQTTSQVAIADSTSAFSVGTKYTPPSCYGRCDATLSSEVKGGTAPFRYEWSGINATQPQLTAVCGTGQTMLTITDDKGCVLRSTPVALTSPEPRPLDLAKELEVCPTQPFSLNASTLSWGKSFIWSYPDGTTRQGAIVQADSLGIYELTALDENSCGGKQQVTVKPFTYVKQLFTLPSEALVDKPVVCVDLTNPVPSAIRWQYIGGNLVSQDAYSVKIRFPQVGTYKIVETVTVDNCEYPLTKTIEIRDQINNGGFPAPVGMRPFQVEVMGNPVTGNQVKLAVENEANEDFTVMVHSSAGDRVLVRKSFTNTGSDPVTLDLPAMQLISGTYILTVVTPTTKISKILLINR